MGTQMTETAEARLKRMSMRSWRRGTKEMDLILGPFADAHLAGLGASDLLLYDQLLEENDQDLITYILGQNAAPPHLHSLIAQIAEFARHRLVRTDSAQTRL
jgi:antitoxin CptB